MIKEILMQIKLCKYFSLCKLNFKKVKRIYRMRIQMKVYFIKINRVLYRNQKAGEILKMSYPINLIKKQLLKH
jgi:hypothetical protein